MVFYCEVEMKAELFIQKYGLDEARTIVKEAIGLKEDLTGSWELNQFNWDLSKKDFYPRHNENRVSASDLKEFIDAVDKVNSFGGLEDAKAVCKMGRFYKYLKRAIKKVESLVV